MDIKTKEEIENPLLKMIEKEQEYLSNVTSFQELSFFEKIGWVSSFITAIAILIISIFSIVIDFGRLNVTNIVLELIFFGMGLSILYFMFNMYRRKIVIETLIDTAFQEGIYNRLKPLVENIAQSRVDADIILDRMSNIDLKIENILKEKIFEKEEKEIGVKGISLEKYIELQLQRPITTGTSFQFIFKSIFMIIITMAAFMFLVNFNLGSLTPYSVLLLFSLWWIFITNEYNLWKNNSAWYAIFIPIVLTPVSVMVLGNILNYNILMAILYLSVGLFAFFYYLWAVYLTTGIIPFLKTKEIEQKEKEKFFNIQQKGLLKELSTEIKNRLKK